MIAEDGCLTLQKEIFVNDISNIRYSNLNLSHNTCSMSKDHIVNFVRKDITKVPNYDSTDVDFSQITKDSIFLNKSHKTFNCINIISDNFNNKKEKKNFLNATIKSSTISLHISAYENSTKAAALDLFSGENQLNLIQKWETLIQNPLEFPRQQNNKIMEPEIAQFKASQKLLNPNESVTLNKNENVSPEGSSVSYGAPLSDPAFQYSTNQHIFPTTDYGAPIGFNVAYQYSLANGYRAPVG
uniref:Uncharacterized protein n=1 Tax=Panagrolaimus sp. PS1159 TaxID=55785 RepID=A0AC35GFU9_9BILA